MSFRFLSVGFLIARLILSIVPLSVFLGGVGVSSFSNSMRLNSGKEVNGITIARISLLIQEALVDILFVFRGFEHPRVAHFLSSPLQSS